MPVLGDPQVTQTEFIAHWQDRLIGLGLRGLVHDTDERTRGAGGAGLRALELVDAIPKLLASMYGTAQPDQGPAPGQVTNPPAEGGKNRGEGQQAGRDPNGRR